ncbi:MAG TPA: fatty acid desaturase [Gammaproteobacteria bacterium]|nr:fatty acid desaturase [Gammaproteobacteria bacterium]
MLTGLLELPVWGYVVVALVLTQITIAGVTVYLHRHQAHRALDLHPVPSHFFRFWLWLTTGMVTKQWVAVHRKHHAKCETEEDPHSPQVLGIRKVLWQGAELYRKEARNSETQSKYGHATPDDWLERKVYSRYPLLGVALMAVIDIALFGVLGLTVWAVQMIWIPFWAAGVINGGGHYWGYRNFETSDAATNLVPWGLIIGGEELHNNHHAYPSSARFSNKWWEFDIGWLYCRVFAALGLARIKKVAPKAIIASDKHIIDLDTVTAVVRNRFHILTLYGRRVILPVLREELHRADESCRKLFRRARKPLVREDIRLDAETNETLTDALNQSKTLETVYQFKQQLKELWERSAANQEKLLQNLQEWCQRAEQTGIKTLQDFARSLRGYSLQPA